jgi:hypothetical protein
MSHFRRHVSKKRVRIVNVINQEFLVVLGLQKYLGCHVLGLFGVCYYKVFEGAVDLLKRLLNRDVGKSLFFFAVHPDEQGKKSLLFRRQHTYRIKLAFKEGCELLPLGRYFKQRDLVQLLFSKGDHFLIQLSVLSFKWHQRFNHCLDWNFHFRKNLALKLLLTRGSIDWVNCKAAFEKINEGRRIVAKLVAVVARNQHFVLVSLNVKVHPLLG